MADEQEQAHEEPVVSEDKYAFERFWQLHEDERLRLRADRHSPEGVSDAEFGAQKGSEPVNTASAASDDNVERAREALMKED